MKHDPAGRRLNFYCEFLHKCVMWPNYYSTTGGSLIQNPLKIFVDQRKKSERRTCTWTGQMQRVLQLELSQHFQSD
jgi:hypothetical protein